MQPVSQDSKWVRFIKKEKPVVIFLLKLLILLFFLKLLFYFWNKDVTGQPGRVTGKNIVSLLKWSFENDALVLLLINTPYFILLALVSFIKKNSYPVIFITAVFLLINFSCILLNLIDVFYFHFHLQRADADLLYVIQHPFEKIFMKNPFWGIAGSLVFILIFFLLLKKNRRLLGDYKDGKQFRISSVIMLLLCGFFFLYGTKRLIPTYPLIQLNSGELQLVQNSFHTFLYSVYRKDEAIVKQYDFMPDSMAVKLSPVNNTVCKAAHGKKNIVLFIMESVPEDFFDTAGKYKVAMPFLDSLVRQSTYFSNAYSYGHSSNKGIVSILAGIPTLTEIPLYHSNYSAIKVASIGNLLAAEGYSSSFFIGDNYDDFGFAKCCNWLGIQHYYSREAMSGYEINAESNTMGLHDGYVLDFMNKKINETQQPFLAINYNTSTHYPNDLPSSYKEKFPQQNFTDQMKSMSYYNESLQNFFKNASTQSWYDNTVFIFCADHWMYPNSNSMTSDMVQGFHIPIFTFDPSALQQKIVNSPVSQFDVLNTILCIAGTKDPFISYGKNLLDSVQDTNRTVFSKENNNLYQVMDSSYVLGFNPVTGKAEFCYNYKTDLKRSNNLIPGNIADGLTLKIKAFLQTASQHYNRTGAFK